MKRYTLTRALCIRCGQPLVEEWLMYWLDPHHAHANCRIFAESLKTNPDWFGLDAEGVTS